MKVFEERGNDMKGQYNFRFFFIIFIMFLIK